MDSDYLLASGSGEPPRKRRAAAVAAQKNWQMLNKPEDDIIDIEEDLVEVNRIGPRSSLPSIVQAMSATTSKRGSMPNTVIDLNRSKKATDRDYSPTEDLLRQVHGMKARKTFPTPSTPTSQQPIRQSHRQTIQQPIILSRSQPQMPIRTQVMVRTQMPTRAQTPVRANMSIRSHPITPTRIRSPSVGTTYALRAPSVRTPIRPPIIRGNPVRSQPAVKPQTVLIESENSSRIITRTDSSQQRKPVIIKNHPSEPLDLPTVEGEVEETVGTYIDDQEVIVPDDNDWTDELSLILFCESEGKTLKSAKENQDSKDDDIEVIEVINGRQVLSQNLSKAVTQKSFRNRGRPNKVKAHLDSIIDTLEMHCENLDDDHTDGIWMDCEEDILSEAQWKLSEDSVKTYNEYQKSVTSTKNVKFLPEAEVDQPIGVTTTTVSETTRMITKTTVSKPIRVSARPNTVQSQSIRGPVPSISNSFSTSLPTHLPQNFTILPMTPTSGVNSPVILAPTTLVGGSGGLAPGLRFILQPQGTGTQSTLVMLSQQSPTVVPAQSIIVSNGNPIYPSNIVATAGQNIRLTTSLSNPLRPRIISQQIQTAIRTPVAGVRGRPPIYRVSSQASPQLNQTNRGSNNQLFDCLTNFKSAPSSIKKINMTTVLTIKPLPFSWPSNIDDLINSLIKLDNALMKEKFKEAPIAWMVRNSLIVPPKCRACLKGVCNQVSKAANSKNEYWQCNNSACNRSYVIDRPRIFNGPKFEIPVSKLLFLIYYWSIQVDVDDLIKTGQIEMGTDKIFNVWSRLQKVCSLALMSKDARLGSSNREVEIASVQVGRFQVLGAMESSSHRTKLTVVPVSEIIQQNGKNAVMLPFVKWIDKSSTIKTCESKFLSLRDYGFKVVCQTKNDFLTSNKNSLNTISGYLFHHLQRFFKDFDLSTLTHEILANILDELLWRERYGTNPFTAFYNIIKHIGEQCALKKPEYDITVTQKAPTPQTGIRTPPVSTYSRPNRPLTSQLDETNSVFVEEYYYSSLKLKDNASKVTSQEDTSKDGIQCHLCQMFFDNILIIKHLLEHLEKERRGRVRKGDNNETECKHCLRFYGNRALHMHEELANLKLVPFSCRICLRPFLARQPFIGHMKTSHFSGEMPYYCDICSYRSSFQKNLFDHFEASHSKCNQIICPFCIRVFDGLKSRNISISEFLYRHLTTHYAIASVYDCENCVLTFTSKDDLMEHCSKGHNPCNVVDEKFEVTPHVVSEEEKKLCVRAREQELFTPFLPTAGNVGEEKNDRERDNENNANDNLNNQTNANGNDYNVENLEISCDINIDDFLAIEPEVQINLADETIPSLDSIISVEYNYSDDQLKQILTKSFDIDSNSDEQKEFICEDNKRVVCYECGTDMTSEHLCHRLVCHKCQFTTHCRTAFESHTSYGHKEAANSSGKQISIFKPIPELFRYQLICSECEFTSLDGNQFALHMIKSTHLDIACRPLKVLGEEVKAQRSPQLNESKLRAQSEFPTENRIKGQTEKGTQEGTEDRSLHRSQHRSEDQLEDRTETETETDTEVTEGVVDNERTDQ